MEDNITNKELKTAFIRALDARISLILEDHLWDYLLNETEEICKYKTQWNAFKDFLKINFNNDISLYYKELFKLCDIFENIGDELKQNYPIILDNMYNEYLFNFVCNNNVNGGFLKDKHYYLSIDLKDAFFQELNYFNLFSNKTLFDFLLEKKSMPDLLKFRGNKFLCCDKVINKTGNQLFVRMALVILTKIYESDHEVFKLINEQNLKLVKIRTDELIFEIGENNNLPEYFIKNYCNKEISILNFICHVNVFQYNLIHYTINNIEMYKSYFKNILNNNIKFNVKNCLYLLKLYKLYNNITLNEEDEFIIGIGGKKQKFSDDIKLL